MKVHFKGTRGSIPTAPNAADIRQKVINALLKARGKDLRSEGQIRTFVDETLNFRTRATWGGNTPCAHIETGDSDYILMDAGSGLRVFGKEQMAKGEVGATYHIFLSHFHYDHIQGIPFFTPAYIPGNQIVFHGGHQGLESFLRRQMTEPFFPIGFDTFAADISFEEHTPGDVIEIGNAKISLFKQKHPGDSYGYRVDANVKSVVYSTDSEHGEEAHNKDYPYLDFIRDANLLIFDAPYTHSQSIGSREDWGHSSNVMGVELAARGKVEKLAIMHHDPNASDDEVSEFFAHTRKFLAGTKHAVREAKPGIPGAPSPRSHPYEVVFTYDGLTLTV